MEAIVDRVTRLLAVRVVGPSTLLRVCTVLKAIVNSDKYTDDALNYYLPSLLGFNLHSTTRQPDFVSEDVATFVAGLTGRAVFVMTHNVLQMTIHQLQAIDERDGHLQAYLPHSPSGKAPVIVKWAQTVNHFETVRSQSGTSLVSIGNRFGFGLRDYNQSIQNLKSSSQHFGFHLDTIEVKVRNQAEEEAIPSGNDLMQSAAIESLRRNLLQHRHFLYTLYCGGTTRARQDDWRVNLIGKYQKDQLKQLGLQLQQAIELIAKDKEITINLHELEAFWHHKIHPKTTEKIYATEKLSNSSLKRTRPISRATCGTLRLLSNTRPVC